MVSIAHVLRLRKALDARIGRLTNDTSELLRTGMVATSPEVAKNIAAIHRLYARYAANPAFGVSLQVIDAELREKDQQFRRS